MKDVTYYCIDKNGRTKLRAKTDAAAVDEVRTGWRSGYEDQGFTLRITKQTVETIWERDKQ
jgi:hypothetical protein